jgi:hypothetical protein
VATGDEGAANPGGWIGERGEGSSPGVLNGGDAWPGEAVRGDAGPGDPNPGDASPGDDVDEAPGQHQERKRRDQEHAHALDRRGTPQR